MTLRVAPGKGRSRGQSVCRRDPGGASNQSLILPLPRIRGTWLCSPAASALASSIRAARVKTGFFLLVFCHFIKRNYLALAQWRASLDFLRWVVFSECGGLTPLWLAWLDTPKTPAFLQKTSLPNGGDVSHARLCCPVEPGQRKAASSRRTPKAFGRLSIL